LNNNGKTFIVKIAATVAAESQPLEIKEEISMGLFKTNTTGNFLTNEEYPLSRLRHALWEDWYHGFEIKTFPNKHGIFRPNGHSEKTYKATLKDCTCDDRAEDGTLIRPCVHMYRLALETGDFEAMVRNPQIEKAVREMRNPLFNNFFQGVIARGYYSEPHQWNLSRVTFEELKTLGLIQGEQKEYRLTAFFMDNAAAWVYYTMTDQRSKK
jgi:hypothetical protein